MKVPASVGTLTLVLGGARSGKSRYAEALIQTHAPPWIYVATAEARDEEMTQRIAEHRARRAAEWRTLEAPHSLPEAIEEAQDRAPILIDCLTLWLSNLLLAETDVERECGRLEAGLARRSTSIVLVANEVGLGIVPDNSLARHFRDAAGRLNQRLAARADRVIFVAAGLPLQLK